MRRARIAARRGSNMHSCPECGSACYCGGDIDDIDTGDEEAEDGCTCCAEGDGKEEMEDSDDGFYDSEL